MSSGIADLFQHLELGGELQTLPSAVEYSELVRERSQWRSLHEEEDLTLRRSGPAIEGAAVGVLRGSQHLGDLGPGWWLCPVVMVDSRHLHAAAQLCHTDGLLCHVRARRDDFAKADVRRRDVERQRLRHEVGVLLGGGGGGAMVVGVRGLPVPLWQLPRIGFHAVRAWRVIIGAAFGRPAVDLLLHSLGRVCHGWRPDCTVIDYLG
mmetsp:Transcript_13874/g.39278  ORF Transcript_13874/g.39278 Transcript_13874/m.39278 type:complete len:207 (-) Transcript_13874:1281-1901(-)